jgi:hypothetical protein
MKNVLCKVLKPHPFGAARRKPGQEYKMPEPQALVFETLGLVARVPAPVVKKPLSDFIPQETNSAPEPKRKPGRPRHAGSREYERRDMQAEEI